MTENDPDQATVSTVAGILMHKITEALGAMPIGDLRTLVAEMEREVGQHRDDAQLRA